MTTFASSRPAAPYAHRTLRFRLTALFVLGSALLVAAGGLFLVNDQRRRSAALVTKGLEDRLERITEVLETERRLPTTEYYAQVIDQFRNVIDLSDVLANDYLLSEDQLRFVFQEGRLQIDRPLPGLGTRGRLLAERRNINGSSVVIVVGASRDVESDVRRRLLLTLAIGGPLLTALLGLGGWLLAGAALRPVRRMIDEASSISTADTGRRLPLTGGDDEISHLGQTLNGMLDRLEQSFARERSFVDDASHELRTPLAVLRGELELAQLHPGDETETRQTLERGLVEVKRLQAIAEDLLVLARAGTPSAPREPSNAVAIAYEAAQRTSDRQIRISVICENNQAMVAMGPDQLLRALTNLIDNATRFARSAVVVRIAPTVGADPTSFVTIDVDDDGPGFPPEFLPHVFERFAVADRARTRRLGQSSTGLGLAIVRALVEQCGGTVTAHNRTEGGARVTMQIPETTSTP